MDLDIDNMQKNYEKFKALCKKTGKNSKKLEKLVDALGERLIMSPSSGKDEYFNAFPGGLLDHSLKILEASYKVAKGCGIEIENESIILCSLFCLIGKVGDEKRDLFIPQDNQWRRENLGECYIFNPELKPMRASHRSLYLLQKFGVDLSHDEWMAIILSDGVSDETHMYSMKEPQLAVLIMAANKLIQAKAREDNTPVPF